MHKAAQCELQSSRWLAGNTADRPSFHAMIRRGLSGPRPFQVFALPTGMLFLELKQKPGTGGNGPNGAVVVGAVLGGAIGACIGAAVAGSTSSGTPELEGGFDMCGEDQLIELARKRKRSFVAKYDEICSVSIDAPGALGRLFAARSLVGWITMHDSTLGKVPMEIRDPLAMAVAVEALPRRLGERVQINVELDPHTTRFVPKRG
jgi:hypothetical protein